MAETSAATALPASRTGEEPLSANLSLESWPHSLRQAREREI
jgi:hypothetical protein